MLQDGEVAEPDPARGYSSKFFGNLATGGKHVILFISMVSAGKEVGT